jgi:ABC-type uncharacterized transport system fused permease/ATPase subunit
MTSKLSTRLAAAHGFVAKLWKLTAPYFWSEERWSARALLAIVIGSGVLLVYLAKLLSGGITLPVLGGITIPGYMMWAAVGYAAIGSWLTYRIGRPLIRVNFDLQRYNADSATGWSGCARTPRASHCIAASRTRSDGSTARSAGSSVPGGTSCATTSG